MIFLEDATGIKAPDSPEAMPGSVLHRLGRERRSKATTERGPRLQNRFNSIFTNLHFFSGHTAMVHNSIHITHRSN